VEVRPSIQVHNTFHVSMLEPYRTSRYWNRHHPPRPPEEVEGQENWEVELMADSRRNKGKRRVENLFFWKGFPPEQVTWEPWENLEGTGEDAIKEIHNGHPRKPRDEEFSKCCESIPFHR